LPVGSAPKAPVTVPPALLHVPAVVVQDTNVTPAGSASVTVTPAAEPVPMLEMVRLYTMLAPLVTLGGAVLLIDKSGATVHGSRWVRLAVAAQPEAVWVTVPVVGPVAGIGVPAGVPAGQTAAVAAPAGVVTVREVPAGSAAVTVPATVP